MFPIRDHNPSRRTPYVTCALIAVNVGIFLIMLRDAGDPRATAAILETFGLVPAQVSAGYGIAGFVTSMFLHAGVLHLGGNMLFLWIFGDNLEDRFGHAGFLGFYLAGGIAAALIQYLSAPLSQIPMVGASGAIAAVMGGYLLMFPRARIDLLVIIFFYVRIFVVPAWAMLGLWFVIQAVGSYNTLGVDRGGVAYFAHAGGFAAGLLLTVPHWLRAGGPAFWRRFRGIPPHPAGRPVRWRQTTIPRVRRKQKRRGPWG